MSDKTMHLTEHEFRRYVDEAFVNGSMATLDVIAQVVDELRAKYAAEHEEPA